ncbi:AI-2E family transporter [bacterium]|jgi:AI-2 transport protein TqsA|nr:AI-2E family transporter [bacterium]
MTENIKDSIVPLSILLIAGMMLTGALYLMRPVLVPFVFSLFLFFLVSPFINWLKYHLKIPKSLTIGVTLILLIFGFFFALIVLGVSLKEFVQSSGVYQENLINLLDKTAAIFSEYGYTIDLSLVRQSLLNLPLFDWFTSFSGGVFGLVGNLVLVLIFTFFLVVGSESQERVAGGQFLEDEVRNKITRYIATKCFTSGLTGLLIWGIFSLFNVKLALMFGVITFFLNFIPSVGSIMATLLPIPVLLLQFGPSVSLIAVLAISAAIQFVVGNILDPKLLGENLGMNPVVILLSLLFWGFIWGVPGMFLSVPMTAVIKLLLNRAQFKTRMGIMVDSLIGS